MSQPLTLFEPEETEGDYLPFGPINLPISDCPLPDKTPLLLDVAQSIRRFGGTVWSIDKVEGTGLLFRFEIAACQFRILVPMPGQVSPVDFPEKGSPCHIVQTLGKLESWLRVCVDQQLASNYTNP